jgi:cob(I)alamin adenosyltransferase
MVKLTRIYTKGGDKGETSLGRGERVAKHDPRVEAYGTVDEANSVIGLARAAVERTLKNDAHRAHVDEMLKRIQNDLFDLGADLCTPDQGKGKGPGGARLAVTDAQVTRLEQEIDTLNEDLAPLRSFVLPGGTPAAAALHLARTVCRRGERMMVELSDRPGEEVSAAALKYVNRLSDFLFVAGRFLNRKGTNDILWVPGQNR